MKYLSINTVLHSFDGCRNKTQNKFWGMVSIIKAIGQKIIPATKYSFSVEKVQTYLEDLFRLEDVKKTYSTSNMWSVVFSKYWIDFVPEQMFSSKPNIYDVAAWFYRRTAFDDDTTSEQIVGSFMDLLNISLEDSKKWFSFQTISYTFETQLYSESNLMDSILKKLSISNSSNKTLSFEGLTFIKSNPGSLGQAPFVQTLYANQGLQKCLILTQFDFQDFYPVTKKTLPTNNIDNSKHQQTLNITPIVKSILSTGLIYSHTLIKCLAYSLMAKPFVILSGLAGSGKTQLALAFAKCLSENIKEQVCTVSIGADWTNREPLLGYPNALNKDEYVKPESGVLQLLMRANKDPDKPYFLILDEMNLSVVERYFADFLSAMESGEPIKLWDNENGDVPKEIELSKNVFIIGTINVDETTYMFSPKVLDRANVIEFKIAPDEMDEYLGKKVNINLEQAYSACADMAVDFVNKAKSQVEKDEKNKDVLLSFFTELKKVNAEFGYRTVNEISRYLHFSDGELTADSAIDTAILQKLLPKLHGSRKKLVPVLTSMWKLCLNDGITKEIDAEFSATDFKYPESAEKIQRMYHAVVDNGFTSFAEA